MFLVAEILDRFVVQQAVDGLGVGLFVGFVHAPHELDAPFGHGEGEADIDDDRNEHDGGERRVVAVQQDAAHEADFDQRRQYVEEHEGEQELDALRAALDGPAQAAGAAVEMETQGERVQMAENPQRHLAHRLLRDAGEHGVAQFAERHREEARDAERDDQRHGHDDRAGAEAFVERVHHAAEQEGDLHDGDFRAEQQQRREYHAGANIQAARGPQIGEQGADGAGVAAPPRAHGGGFGQGAAPGGRRRPPRGRPQPSAAMPGKKSICPGKIRSGSSIRSRFASNIAMWRSPRP